MFHDYLALPAEEYSLLDPKWMARLDDCSFRLTVPVRDVVVELGPGAPWPDMLIRFEPAITVRTELDRAARTVTLRGGEATFDAEYTAELAREGFELGFTTTLTWSGGPGEGEAPGGAEPVTPWNLACAVDVRGTFPMGPPLSKLPGPLLGGFIGLMGTAVAQVALPGFAQILALDYERWALGKERLSLDGALLEPPSSTSSAAADAAVDVAPAEPAAVGAEE